MTIKDFVTRDYEILVKEEELTEVLKILNSERIGCRRKGLTIGTDDSMENRWFIYFRASVTEWDKIFHKLANFDVVRRVHIDYETLELRIKKVEP